MCHSFWLPNLIPIPILTTSQRQVNQLQGCYTLQVTHGDS